MSAFKASRLGQLLSRLGHNLFGTLVWIGQLFPKRPIDAAIYILIATPAMVYLMIVLTGGYFRSIIIIVMLYIVSWFCARHAERMYK